MSGIGRAGIKIESRMGRGQQEGEEQEGERERKRGEEGEKDEVTEQPLRV